MAFYLVASTGKGFITHAEMEADYIQSLPGNIWRTTNTAWANRVGALQKTPPEARAIVLGAISGSVEEMYAETKDTLVTILGRVPSLTQAQKDEIRAAMRDVLQEKVQTFYQQVIQ